MALDCLFDKLFKLTTAKPSKHRISGPFVRESNSDCWIPLTKGQYCGKCSHIKISSCILWDILYVTMTIPWYLPETALNFWPFVRGIHSWLVDSPHKGLVIHKVFLSRRHLISLRDILYTYLWTFPGICLRQIFISGHLWGESTIDWWISLTKGQ